MTYNEDSAAYVVGLCYYTCFLDYIYYSIPSQINATELNTFMSCNYHRDAQLCSKCKHGFAPLAYFYSLTCVECSNYTMNWIKYIAVAFLPLTLFLGVIVVFRLSVTSGFCIGNILFYATAIMLSYKFSSYKTLCLSSVTVYITHSITKEGFFLECMYYTVMFIFHQFLMKKKRFTSEGA